MIGDKSQNQEGGDKSQNVQANTVNIHNHYGLTIDQAREIALQVFKENFLELSKQAAETANARAEELVNKYLEELEKRNPDGMDNMNDPGMQHALFIAQKEYARTGDNDLSDMLVDLLVDRSALPYRNLKQIVIDESLTVASKLTLNQLDALTLIFFMKYATRLGLSNLEQLRESMKSDIMPFTENLSKENSLYQHLEYCGCGSISISSSQIEQIILNRYKGLFSKGLSKEQVDQQIGENKHLEKYIIPCLTDNSLKQVAFVSEDDLKKDLEDKIQPNEFQILKRLLNTNTKSQVEVKELLEKQGDYMVKFLDTWNNSSMKSMTLTSVGIAIAQANYRRKTGQTIDLGIWIK